MNQQEIVLIESNKVAIKKILKDLQADGALSNYAMAMILESILCDYRSEATYEYITAQIVVNSPNQSTETQEQA